MIAGNIRFALRLLIRNPLFAVIAVFTLGAGIGANTAIFSALDSLLIHPLPFPDPDRVLLVTKNMPKFNLVKSDASALDYLDYQRFSRSFSELAAITSRSFNLTGDIDPERLFGLRVSANLCQMLGVRPLLGRVFRTEEAEPGQNRVALLGEPLWRDRFGADPRILGRQIQLDGESYTVIGVMEPVLQFLEISQIYVPLTFDSRDLAPDSRGHQFVDVIGRLRSGVSIQQARAEMKVVAGRMTQQLPDWYPPGWNIDLDPLKESVAGELRVPLLVLMAGVGLLLLTACANIANLLLARATSRQREIGIRTALGARRSDIAAQLLTESTLLAAFAGVLGLILGIWALDAVSRFAPPEMLRRQTLHMNGWVAAFTFAISAATSLVFGLAPALSACRFDVNDAIKASSRGVAGARSSLRMRNVLVSVEVALSVVLLVASGLLVRSLMRLESVSPGFQTDHLLTARLTLPPTRYPGASQIRAFYSDLRSRIATIPGVASVGFASGIPFGAGAGGGSFDIVGRPWAATEAVPDVGKRIVSPSYMETLRTPLKAGRTFSEQDGPETQRVAVVDEHFARAFFREGKALGWQITGPGSKGPNSEAYRIVGIVGGMKDRNLMNDEKATIYYCSQQAPYFYMSAVVRTTVDPFRVAGAIQSLVRSIDRGLPVYRIATMQQLVADTLLRRRVSSWLLAILAGLAMLLSAIGIYGVVAYSVAQRTAEIGIRMALGAAARDVRGLVLRQALGPVLTGMVTGLVLSVAIARLLATMLYSVTATDPMTYLVVPSLLLAISLLAVLAPARRATKIDPSTAMRCE